MGLKEVFLKDGRKPLQRRTHSERVHAPAPGSSPVTPGLLGQNQHAVAARVFIFTAENILFLSYGQFESGHEL